MKLTEEVIGDSGVKYIFEYEDADSFDNLPSAQVTQVYGVCFCGDKIVIGYGGKKNAWGLIGGTIEKGETYEETLMREIQEESNMKVLTYTPVGYQKAIDSRDGSFVYQIRYVCTVHPYAPFVSDPAGGVTEIKLIDPADYKQYFDWKSIGDRIISRAIELKSKLT